MSAEVVNLRRARKAKQRAADADRAAGNRFRFGQSKAQRSLDAAVEARDQRRFEAHRRDSSQSGIDTTQSDMSKEGRNGQ